MNEDFKKLVFKDVNDLEEALMIPLCKKFYNQLAQKEGVEVAKRETLSLYNESRWLTCQDLLGLLLIDPMVLRPATNSKFYDTSWLLALQGATSGLTINKTIAKEMPLLMQLLDEETKIPEKERPYLNDWGFPNKSCPITYAPLDEWGDLNRYYWDEMTAMFNLELLDQLYEKAYTWEKRQELFDAIRSDAKVTWGDSMKDDEVYLWLCKVKIELLKAPSDEFEKSKNTIEENVLFLQKGNEKLDVGYLKSCLKELIRHEAIPSKGYGYIWYAVWLFFKKNKLLKDDSQRAFHRLMNCWFPNCGYGDDDKMRLYNSLYLEQYRWQIWKYEEFKKTAKGKASERGFNAIYALSENLERQIDTQIMWKKEL